MIIYSRFNSRQYSIEQNRSPQLLEHEAHKATRRMQLLRFDDIWLQERLDLFNAFTLPSVLSQTNQKFRWVGIAHPNSPDWFLEELGKVDRMELVLVDLDIEAKESKHTTINLDTDDAISRDFVAEVRKLDFEGETIFPRGMRYRILTNCWIATRAYNSHFNIVQHPTQTVLDFSHGMGPLEKQIVDIKRSMWLEVIHERNISNRLRTAKKDRNLGEREAAKFFEVNP